MKIIIVGSGRLGSGLAHILNERGHQVTVVDRDNTKFDNLGTSFKGEIIQGVGFDRDVLLKAGIERSDALAAVSDSDDANIVIALLARNIFQVPKVVARVYDPQQAEIYKRLGIRTITPIELGAARIADMLGSSELDSLIMLGSGEMEIMQIEVPLGLVGKSVAELTRAGELVIISVTRDSKAFIPLQGTLFEQHDIIHLGIMRSAVQHLNRMLGLK